MINSVPLRLGQVQNCKSFVQTMPNSVLFLPKTHSTKDLLLIKVDLKKRKKKLKRFFCLCLKCKMVDHQNIVSLLIRNRKSHLRSHSFSCDKTRQNLPLDVKKKLLKICQTKFCKFLTTGKTLNC